MIARRSLLRLSAGLIATSLAGRSATAQTSLAAKLLEPGPLPDKVFGAADAPVTVIEYASLTCHHCMNFHINTWPAFKAKYVDTGKVRFIAREFPLDPLRRPVSCWRAAAMRRNGIRSSTCSTGRRRAGLMPKSRSML